MLQRRDVPFLAVVGLLPFVLAACSDATSSTDPRTQPPLVRVGTVEPLRPGGAFVHRNRRGPRAERPGVPRSRKGPGTPGRYRANRQARPAAHAHRSHGPEARHARAARRPLPLPGRARARPRTTRRDTATSSPQARFRHRPTTESRLPPSRQERSSMRPRPRPTLPATKRATPSCLPMRTAWWSRRWPSRGRSSVPARSSCVWRMPGAARRSSSCPKPCARRSDPPAGRPCMEAGSTGPAKLRQLSDAANRQTRTFEARYVLEGRLADAPLGSTISIQISDGRSAPALQVPIGAIFDPGKGPGVWLVEGETPRVTWRAVQIAGLSDEAASVVGKLEAGDRVVALGAHLLHEGEHVRLAASEAAASVAVNGGARR